MASATIAGAVSVASIIIANAASVASAAAVAIIE